jgi:hypothetical protein
LKEYLLLLVVKESSGSLHTNGDTSSSLVQSDTEFDSTLLTDISDPLRCVWFRGTLKCMGKFAGLRENTSFLLEDNPGNGNPGDTKHI